MKIVCVKEHYVCGTNSDGSPMICVDEYCYIAADNHSPQGAFKDITDGNNSDGDNSQRNPDLFGAIEEAADLLNAFGIKVPSVDRATVEKHITQALLQRRK